MPEADRYLVGNWGELAARYGHKYWYVGGHRDNFPQVITSKYPIENVERIVGERARQRGDARRGVGPHREERSHGQYRDAASLAAGLRLPGDRPWRASRTAATVTAAWRSSISAGIRSAPLPCRRKQLGDAGRQQLVVAARQLVLQMSGGRSAAADAGLRARTHALCRRDRPTASRPVPDDDSFGKSVSISSTARRRSTIA